nr:peptidase M28 [Flavobacteriales bacterium]
MQNIFFLALLAITFSCKTSNNTGVSSSVQVSPADYSKFITAANLKTHLYIISSDEMHGR